VGADSAAAFVAGKSRTGVRKIATPPAWRAAAGLEVVAPARLQSLKNLHFKLILF